MKSGLLCLCCKGVGNYNFEDVEEMVKVILWVSNGVNVGESEGRWG